MSTQPGIRITKRNGNKEPLDITKIRKMTSESTENLDGVSQSELELDAQIKFIDGMSSSDIQDALIKTAVEKIDIDVPNWTFVAARLFIYDLYHKVGRVVGGVKGQPYCHIKDYQNHAIKLERMVPDIYFGYDIEDLNNYIKPERDLLFTYLGVKTLYDKYLIKDHQKNPIELPQHMFMSIAMFLAQYEENKQEKAKEFYDVISQHEVMLATPTLSSARKLRSQLSSCFRAGTKIQLVNDYQNIKNIKIGDLVLTDIGTYEKVTELFSRHYNGTLYSLEICGLNSLLEATEEHPIKGFKNKKVSCYRGTKNKRQGLCIGRQYKKTTCFKMEKCYSNDCIDLDKKFEPEWIAINELEPTDFVNISFPTYEHGITSFNINEIISIKNMIEENGKLYLKNETNSTRSFKPVLNQTINPIINTINIDKDFMLMIGYYLAEGHVSKDLSNVYFTFGTKEKDYQLFIKEYFTNVFGIEPNIQINRDNSTNVIVGSRIIATLIMELCGSGFNIKKLNDMIFFADKSIQSYLLAGVIRGDGCAISNGYQLVLSNEYLINQLFQISLRCGLSPHLYNPFQSKLATTPGYTIVYNHIDKDFIQLVNKNIQKINFAAKIQLNNRFWYNNEYYMEIKDINKEEFIGTVYNIEVENTHSYVVNNVSVHNCYIGAAPDNIEGIFDSYKEMALLSKHGGGIGWDWNDIRSMGGVIDNNKSAAGGTVPFLKITNDIAIAVDQLGVRKGAIAVYLEPWHMDISDFIDLKKNSGEDRRRAHDLFPALWINDLFMERVLEDGQWTLFDPYETKDLHQLTNEAFDRAYVAYEHRTDIRKETIKAKDLWKKILTSYFESGSPFLCWKDTANRANPNPHVGNIRSSNLCTEIFQNTEPDTYQMKIYLEDINKITINIDEMDTLIIPEDATVFLENNFTKKAKNINQLDTITGYSTGEDENYVLVKMNSNRKVFTVEKERIPGKTAVCNLASVNLDRINTKEDIERVIPIAINMLDNVIDLNYYPLSKVKTTNLSSRAIGLGSMGEATYLARNSIMFGSQEHLDKIDFIFECISYNAIKASSTLGREKGNYPDFEGSNWNKGILPYDHANHHVIELITSGKATTAYSESEWEVLRDVASKNMRNGYLMAIAPTSSISILVGVSQGNEPVYKRKWFEENLSGLIPVVVKDLNPNTWGFYVPAFEVDQLSIIKAAAIRQKWLDQGQSTNIFMSLDKASGKYLHEIYTLAWKLGLKSTYYLRSQSPDAKKAEAKSEDTKDVVDRSMECSGCQ